MNQRPSRPIIDDLARSRPGLLADLQWLPVRTRALMLEQAQDRGTFWGHPRPVTAALPYRQGCLCPAGHPRQGRGGGTHGARPCTITTIMSRAASARSVRRGVLERAISFRLGAVEREPQPLPGQRGIRPAAGDGPGRRVRRGGGRPLAGGAWLAGHRARPVHGGARAGRPARGGGRARDRGPDRLGARRPDRLGSRRGPRRPGLQPVPAPAAEPRAVLLRTLARAVAPGGRC